MAEQGDILDARGAADYLVIHEETLRRLAREGRIPAFKVGGSWRFNKSRLDEWAEGQGMASGEKHILVVDDEEEVHRAVKGLLEREGYGVTCASSGAEALEILDTRAPDAVLLDLRLREMSGAAVLRYIRERHGMLPVIIITGYPAGDLMAQALQYSPVTVLAKPIDRSHLVETLGRLLGTEGPRRARGGSSSTDSA